MISDWIHAVICAASCHSSAALTIRISTAIAGQGCFRDSGRRVHDGDHAVLHPPQARLGPEVLVEAETGGAEVVREGLE